MAELLPKLAELCVQAYISESCRASRVTPISMRSSSRYYGDVTRSYGDRARVFRTPESLWTLLTFGLSPLTFLIWKNLPQLCIFCVSIVFLEVGMNFKLTKNNPENTSPGLVVVPGSRVAVRGGWCRLGRFTAAPKPSNVATW
jgi:hypothetical protein